MKPARTVHIMAMDWPSSGVYPDEEPQEGGRVGFDVFVDSSSCSREAAGVLLLSRIRLRLVLAQDEREMG